MKFHSNLARSHLAAVRTVVTGCVPPAPDTGSPPEATEGLLHLPVQLLLLTALLLAASQH